MWRSQSLSANHRLQWVTRGANGRKARDRRAEAFASRFTGRAERSFERSALPPLSSEERVSLQLVFLRRARPAQTRRYGNLSLLREAPFFSPSAVY
ncbi:hypothetical protein NDU88_005533 [Pleurodeles waltl]|uniref:Uncharacterized protein n=1 Tax=Pleurodeles waltl TaxID=8319 RepID=A0AAV7VK85_PLEWA|nr:hypothetical protein NDU88_005533 [Pleurodeles waltl]